MVLMGALVDGALASLGGLIGLGLSSKVDKELGDFLMVAVGLCLLVSGVDGMAEVSNLLVTTVEMVLGATIGHLLDIDGQIKRLGDKIQAKFEKHGSKNKGENNFCEGFVVATLFTCVGSMAIIGSLKAGLQGDNSIMYAKSIIDLVSTTLFATSLGAGVILCGVPLFLYQAILVLAAGFLAPYLSDAVVAEMMVTGSLLLFSLGLNMLKATDIKVANLIPACFMPIVIWPLFVMVGMA